MTKKTYTLEELKALKSIIAKNDPASTTLPGTNWHGPLQDGSGNYGLLSEPGVRPEMFSTLVRPTSFMALLTPEPSRYANELLDIMTGVTQESGTNAEDWCGNPPGPGLAKHCKQSYEFGKFFGKTDLNAIPDIGLLKNRADVPRQILNSGPQAYPFYPDLMFRMTNTESRLQADFWRFGVGMERSMARVGISGSTAVASSATEWGWTKEFDGLEQRIKTGHADPGGTLCPALDSIVVDFNEADIDDTVGGGDGRGISEVLVDINFALDDRADTMGIAGFQKVIVMRKELFRALTYQLACDYTTFRCRTTRGDFNVSEERQLQQDMYRRRYLWLDGEEVPVQFDAGIALTKQTAAATYKAGLFFVPMMWSGGRLTRLEYFPMDNPYATEFANFQGNAPAVINNGMYAIAERDNGFCKEYLVAAQMRMILETPWLAARIDDIEFTYRAETRAPYANESFYANGGDTYIPA